MFKIMIIEDDEKLRSMVGEYLEKYGYSMVCVKDYTSIEAQFHKENPHLVLLDINLPYFDGFYLCRAFRRSSKAPIIFMSARSGEMEQVMGIELGADDYITKPFSLELLLAKVKAVLRRAYGEYSENTEKAINVKGIFLDENNFKMQFRNLTMELSKTEFKLIKKLLENKDKIVSREELLSELWDDGAFVDDNTLTVNVTRIKSRLKELGINGAVKTKRGSGYIFDTSFDAGDSHE